jgi:hypothetical protein
MRGLEDGVVQGTRQRLASMSAEDDVLLRAILRHSRIRDISTCDSGPDHDARAAARSMAHSAYRQGLMQTITNQTHDVRPTPDVRFTRQADRAATSPTARRSPVLPRGWAPLTVDQQRAVLRACDLAPDRLTFRLGSLVDQAVDYRVYRLQSEAWAGLRVASRCFTDCDGAVTNRDLLGLGSDALPAVRIALDFFNSDLEARGESWRLGIESPAVPQGDPRRV